MIVVDTNLLVYLHVEGEHTAQAERILRKDAAWAAPLLWRSDMGLVKAVPREFLELQPLLGTRPFSHSLSESSTSPSSFVLLTKPRSGGFLVADGGNISAAKSWALRDRAVEGISLWLCKRSRFDFT